MAERSAMLKRASLRRQVELLHEIRDRIGQEPIEERYAWVEALTPLTDRLLHRLMELEGVPPYPHPIDSPLWVALKIGAN